MILTLLHDFDLVASWHVVGPVAGSDRLVPDEVGLAAELEHVVGGTLAETLKKRSVVNKLGQIIQTNFDIRLYLLISPKLYVK